VSYFPDAVNFGDSGGILTAVLDLLCMPSHCQMTARILLRLGVKNGEILDFYPSLIFGGTLRKSASMSSVGTKAHHVKRFGECQSTDERENDVTKINRHL